MRSFSAALLAGSVSAQLSRVVCPNFSRAWRFSARAAPASNSTRPSRRPQPPASTSRTTSRASMTRITTSRGATTAARTCTPCVCARDACADSGAPADDSSPHAPPHSARPARPQAEWVYTFQICDNVHNVPAVCVPGSPTAGSPAPAPPASGSYPAYQWTNPAFTNSSTAGAPPACYALGQPLAATGTLHNRPTLGLMDVNEPAAGVSVAYASIDAGTDCVDPTGAPRDRSFTLNLQCAYNAWTGAVQQPAGQPNIDGRHFITEVNNCEYQATSWTTAGCPLQCPVTGGALCAGAGICAFDKEALAARCFCDNDLAESDCTAPPNKCVRGPPRAGVAPLVSPVP